jgi:hypothetical protein
MPPNLHVVSRAREAAGGPTVVFFLKPIDKSDTISNISDYMVEGGRIESEKLPRRDSLISFSSFSVMCKASSNTKKALDVGNGSSDARQSVTAPWGWAHVTRLAAFGTRVRGSRSPDVRPVLDDACRRSASNATPIFR